MTLKSKNNNKSNDSSLDFDENNLTFSKAITLIEKICQKLQDDSVELEEIAQYYKKASYLQNFCQERLNQIQNEIELIQKDKI